MARIFPSQSFPSSAAGSPQPQPKSTLPSQSHSPSTIYSHDSSSLVAPELKLQAVESVKENYSI